MTKTRLLSGMMVLVLFTLIGCGEYWLVHPDFSGVYEGYVSFVDDEQKPGALWLSSRIDEVTKERYFFSGESTFQEIHYRLEGTETAVGNMEYIQPANVPTFGLIEAQLINEQGQVAFNLRLRKDGESFSGFIHDGASEEASHEPQPLIGTVFLQKRPLNF